MEKSNLRWIDIKVVKQILLGTIATGDEASLELGGSVNSLRVSGSVARDRVGTSGWEIAKRKP